MRTDARAGSTTRPSRLARALGVGRLSAGARLVLCVVVAVGVAASAVLVYATGGTQHAWVHVAYVPVLLAAWGFGPLGGVVAGVAAGLAVGPLMPVDVEAGVAQATANWAYRLGFFVLVGTVSGGLHQLVGAQLDAARGQRRRFAALVDHTPDVIVACDADGVVGYACPAVKPVLGIDVDALVGRRFVDLVHPDDVATLGELIAADAGPSARTPLRVRHTDGSWRHLEVVASDLLDDPDVAAVVLNARDVTEAQAMHAELAHQATHDRATGLANRDRFGQVLGETLAESSDVAVLLVSLDRFAAMQQTAGPDTADQLVAALARRLSVRLRPGDVLARYATSQFAVLCRDVTSRTGAREIAQRLHAAADEEFLLVSGEVRLSVSVGVALAYEADGDAGQLVRDAHAAALQAISMGGSRVAVFELAWRDEAATALDTETALHSALRRDEFEVHYQPVVDLASGRATSVEALVRWRHPRLGMVSPGDFIPIAEQTGLIAPIGRWVLDTACAQLARWRAEPAHRDLRVAVNISARQLDDPDLLDDVRAALARTGLPADALTLELTETALLGDTSNTIEALTAIKALGVRLAVDDFGTGYSSLGYLKHLPVDTLKIDRTFVAQLDGTDGDDDAIISAIIGLARTLGLDTIAEGVEEQRHADRLAALGCDAAQGYYYARPQPAAELTDALSAADPTRQATCVH